MLDSMSWNTQDSGSFYCYEETMFTCQGVEHFFCHFIIPISAAALTIALRVAANQLSPFFSASVVIQELSNTFLKISNFTASRNASPSSVSGFHCRTMPSP